MPENVQTALERAKKALEKWGSQEENWKENVDWNWERRKVEDERKYLAPKIVLIAPLELAILPLLTELEIVHNGKAAAVQWLTAYDDEAVVRWFRAVQNGLIDLYIPCRNNGEVKEVVGDIIRYSAMHTLSLKYGLKHIKHLATHRGLGAPVTDENGKWLCILSRYKNLPRRRNFIANVFLEKCLNPLLRPLPYLNRGEKTFEPAHFPFLSPLSCSTKTV